MPNGADVPSVAIPIPIPEVGPSFADIGTAIKRFFGFGGEKGFTLEEAARGQAEQARLQEITGLPGPIGPFLAVKLAGRPGVFQQVLSEITGRPPIPTPAEGGPPLVTERFARGAPLPLPILQELGIPFAEPPLLPIPFQPRPIPEPDVLEEEMAADAPLLAGFLPAVRPAIAPTIGAIAGGLLQDVLPSLFARAPQELGAGQIPMPARRAPAQMVAAERPSTRILRQIQASTGVRVKLTSAKALIRQLGLQNGARCLGISVTDACTLIITPSPRRRRGISGSDIRIVKRTARRFQSLQEDLSGLVSRRRAAPRRRKHVHAIAHVAPGG